VFKALELIEFADLIPPLQAELQGTLRAFYVHRAMFPKPYPCPPHLPPDLISVLVYRELAKSKKVSSAAGASSSAPPARNKSGTTAVQRGKGKERVIEAGESSVSAPLPDTLGAPPVEQLQDIQRDDTHADGPTTHAEAYAAMPVVEQDDGEGEGEDDDEDRTELDQPDLEPEHGEEEEHDAEDMDDVDEDVDMNMKMDGDSREVRDIMDDEDEVE
jgi:hypothetical protein